MNTSQERRGRINPQAAAELPGGAQPVAIDRVQDALDQAKAGETIWVASGTYADRQFVWTYKGEGPVAIRAREDGGVRLTGASLVTIRGSRHVVLSGFWFDAVTSDNSVVLDGSSDVHVTENYFYRNGRTPTSKIVGIRNGSARNEIHHNTFDQSYGQSVATYNGHTPDDVNNTDNRIYANLFYNIPTVKSVYNKTNGMEAVQLGQGRDVHVVHRTQVYENVFEHVAGDLDEIISVKTSGNAIYRNSFLNNPSGLTIRLGAGNTIRDNYFENTEKGIRSYGYDQTIARNYLAGGRIGIQFPAADTKTGEKEQVAAPYYQSDRSLITGNIIVRPSEAAFVFGRNYKPDQWPLLPTALRIEDNDVYLSAARAKDYTMHEQAPAFDPSMATFKGNRTFGTDRLNRESVSAGDPAAIAFTITAEPVFPSPSDFWGEEPLGSRDSRTGTAWKQPEPVIR
ncbi:chondroitinase-B domain-containing protein [Paenibacillus sp. GYB004]|uniref:chondroitinase-B domain-containing protein n=1 Tax=Paenibacillus sp. GYB004 TaxID=2994393 RepID=UPI002F96BED0